MKHLQQIESWIDRIEDSDLNPKIKAQRVNTLIDIWRFISYYNETITLKSERIICIENENGIQEEIGLSVKDLILKPTNIISNILLETEQELSKLGSSYIGKYNVQFQKPSFNFCSEKILTLKEELFAIVKGEIICFEHINYIHKNISDKVELFNSNLKILECEKIAIQKTLNKTSIRETPEKQWLLLILDNLKNNCDTFLIDDNIKDLLFKSKFDRVFLFDFYKGQIIELGLEKNSND